MKNLVDRSTDKAYDEYRRRRIEHWDRVARALPPPRYSDRYHHRLNEFFRFLVTPNQRVLEIGSANGDLLATVDPREGLGIDFSPEAVALARERHPQLDFEVADAHDFEVPSPFDVVILSDLINDVWDVQAVLERVMTACTPHTRIILNSYNKAWQGPLSLVRRLRLANPVLPQNWLSRQDVRNLLHLAGFEVVAEYPEILAPIGPPRFMRFFNRFVVKVWPFRHASLTTFVVARPRPEALPHALGEPSVTVLVPARNEAGNIEQIIARTPKMGSRTELIFVEGNSDDDTYATIEEAMGRDGAEHVRLLRQPGKGKGDAVRHGFAEATGDILMILDADMTVAPEELPRFYRAITEGTGEFINGVRLVYPMEGEAMQFLNYLGNKFFGVAFSWLLRQPVKDTLCGTKVLTKEAYDEIVSNRAYFGEFDPFGDFDLLFGAAKSNLKIIDMPIRYRDRTYGSTNIDRWRHGALLLRMVAFASRKLRFV